MRLATMLRLLAPVFVAVAALHLVFGAGTSVILDPSTSAAAISNPTVDSQDRFYGVTFSVYGLLLWMCASDLQRYAPVLRALIWVFWFAGLSRLLSITISGWPSAPVLALLLVEITVPPLLLLWQMRELAHGSPTTP